jgi:hypothetical protein
LNPQAPQFRSLNNHVDPLRGNSSRTPRGTSAGPSGWYSASVAETSDDVEMKDINDQSEGGVRLDNEPTIHWKPHRKQLYPILSMISRDHPESHETEYSTISKVHCTQVDSNTHSRKTTVSLSPNYAASIDSVSTYTVSTHTVSTHTASNHARG